MVVHWLLQLSPLSTPCSLHRHIDCLVGLEIVSLLPSAQSRPPDPSVNRLSLYISTVKTFISCSISIAERPDTQRQVLLSFISPKTFSPTRSRYCCCLDWPFRQMLCDSMHIDQNRNRTWKRGAMDCVTKLGLNLRCAESFPRTRHNGA